MEPQWGHASSCSPPLCQPLPIGILSSVLSPEPASTLAQASPPSVSSLPRLGLVPKVPPSPPSPEAEGPTSPTSTRGTLRGYYRWVLITLLIITGCAAPSLGPTSGGPQSRRCSCSRSHSQVIS